MEKAGDSVIQVEFSVAFLPEWIMVVLVVRLNIGAVGWEQSGMKAIDLVSLIEGQL